MNYAGLNLYLLYKHKLYKSMEKKQTLLQFTMSNGALLGIILIIASLLFYIIGFLPDSIGRAVIIPLINALIVIIFIVRSTKTYRNKILEGSISFGNAFLVGFLVILFAYILRSFYDLIFTTLIDPGYVDRISEGLTNSMYNMYSNMGAPESQIDASLERMTRQQENYTPLRAFFSSILGASILGAILCLITGAILKKEPLPFGQDEQ